MNNPFSLAFGNTPYVEIDRANVEFDIVEDFNREHSVSNAYKMAKDASFAKLIVSAKIDIPIFND